MTGSELEEGKRVMCYTVRQNSACFTVTSSYTQHDFDRSKFMDRKLLARVTSRSWLRYTRADRSGLYIHLRKGDSFERLVSPKRGKTLPYLRKVLPAAVETRM